MENDIPVGFRISILNRAFKRLLDERVEEKGLTGVQFSILGELHKLEQSGAAEINQRTLEIAARVTHPTMTEIIKRLEKKGFIVCRASCNDRRSKSIFSTEKTVSLLREASFLDKCVFEDLCCSLKAEQIKGFESVMDVMIKNASSLSCRKYK